MRFERFLLLLLAVVAASGVRTPVQTFAGLGDMLPLPNRQPVQLYNCEAWGAVNSSQIRYSSTQSDFGKPISMDAAGDFVLEGDGCTLKPSGDAPHIIAFDAAVSSTASVLLSNVSFVGGDTGATGAASRYGPDAAGAAICIGSSAVHLTLEDCTFSSNQARHKGGAVFTQGAAGTQLTRSWFDGNKILRPSNTTLTFDKAPGAAVCAAGGGIAVDGCFFQKNGYTYTVNPMGDTIEAQGGGIAATGSMNVSNSTFASNFAGFRGAAISVELDAGVLRVEHTTFVENTHSSVASPDMNGAALYETGGERAMVTSCQFLTNNGKKYGGVAHFGDDATVTTCQFVDNDDPGGGHGGVMQCKAAGTLNSCVFESNKGGGGEGGVIKFEATATLNSCVFDDNRGGNVAGNVKALQDIRINRTLFKSCYTQGHAGALDVQTAVLSLSTFVENEVANYEAAAMKGGNIVINTCVFQDNRLCGDNRNRNGAWIVALSSVVATSSSFLVTPGSRCPKSHPPLINAGLATVFECYFSIPSDEPMSGKTLQPVFRLADKVVIDGYDSRNNQNSFKRSTFSSCSSNNGGAILTEAGVLIDECCFEANEGGDVGGALVVNQKGSLVCNVIVNRTVFRANKADVHGGAIYVSSDSGAASVLTCAGSTFQGNRARQGGAIAVDGWNKTLALDACFFAGNYAPVGDTIVWIAPDWIPTECPSNKPASSVWRDNGAGEGELVTRHEWREIVGATQNERQQLQWTKSAIQLADNTYNIATCWGGTVIVYAGHHPADHKSTMKGCFGGCGKNEVGNRDIFEVDIEVLSPLPASAAWPSTMDTTRTLQFEYLGGGDRQLVTVSGGDIQAKTLVNGSIRLLASSFERVPACEQGDAHPSWSTPEAGSVAETQGAWLVAHCRPCPQGEPHSFDIVTGMSVCKGCQPSEYGKIVNTTANATGAVTTCMPCEPGHWCTAQYKLQPCTPGKYQAAKSASACIDCAAGLYTPTPAQISCASCPPGYFQSTEGGANCVACPVGQNQRRTGSDACEDCVGGQTYQNDTGKSSCKTCDSCDVGRFTTRSTCTASVGGMAASDTNDNAAAPDYCTECPPGKYGGEKNLKDSCTDCPVGYSQPSSNAVLCDMCQGGTYASERGVQVCTNCTAGRFQAAPGRNACDNCATGSVSMGGMTECTFCPAAFHAAGMDCKACAAGKFQAMPMKTECGACPTGRYQPAHGQASCINCPSGRYQSATGSSSTCLACPIGQFGISEGADSCSWCEDMDTEFAPTEGATTCLKCAANAHVSPNMTSCLCNNIAVNPKTGKELFPEDEGYTPSYFEVGLNDNGGHTRDPNVRTYLSASVVPNATAGKEECKATRLGGDFLIPNTPGCCRPCPDGAICRDGRLFVLPGFWRQGGSKDKPGKGNYVRDKTNDLWHAPGLPFLGRCPNDAACPGDCEYFAGGCDPNKVASSKAELVSTSRSGRRLLQRPGMILAIKVGYSMSPIRLRGGRRMLLPETANTTGVDPFLNFTFARSGPCRLGHTGTLCQECGTEYKVGHSKLCTYCGPSAGSDPTAKIALGISGSLLALAFVVGIVTLPDSADGNEGDETFKAEEAGKDSDTMSSNLDSLLSILPYVQRFSAMHHAFPHFDYPQEMRDVIRWLALAYGSVADVFRILGPCSLSLNFVERLFLQSMIVPWMMVISAAAFTIAKAMLTHMKAARHKTRKVLRAHLRESQRNLLATQDDEAAATGGTTEMSTAGASDNKKAMAAKRGGTVRGAKARARRGSGRHGDTHSSIVRHVRHSKRPLRYKMASVSIRLMMLFIFGVRFLYPGIGSVILKSFVCVDTPDGRVLLEMVSLKCWSADYMIKVGLPGLVAGGILLFGLPMALAWAVLAERRQWKKQMGEEAREKTKALENMLKVRNTMRRLKDKAHRLAVESHHRTAEQRHKVIRRFVRLFKPQYWWWFLVEMLMSLFFIGVLAIFNSDVGIQVTVGGAAAAIQLVLPAKLWPFAKEKPNWIALIGGILYYLQYLSGLAKLLAGSTASKDRREKLDRADNVILVITFAIVIGITFVVAEALYAVSRHIAQVSCRPKQKKRGKGRRSASSHRGRRQHKGNKVVPVASSSKPGRLAKSKKKKRSSSSLLGKLGASMRSPESGHDNDKVELTMENYDDMKPSLSRVRPPTRRVLQACGPGLQMRYLKQWEQLLALHLEVVAVAMQATTRGFLERHAQCERVSEDTSAMLRDARAASSASPLSSESKLSKQTSKSLAKVRSPGELAAIRIQSSARGLLLRAHVKNENLLREELAAERSKELELERQLSEELEKEEELQRSLTTMRAKYMSTRFGLGKEQEQEADKMEAKRILSEHEAETAEHRAQLEKSKHSANRKSMARNKKRRLNLVLAALEKELAGGEQKRGATEVRLMLEALDANKNGQIEFHELWNLVQNLSLASGHAMTQEDVRQVVELMDEDESGEVSVEELMSGLGFTG